jgi:hypothetical protein
MITPKEQQMDKDGFRRHLQDRDIAPEEIEQHLSIIERFESFLQDIGRQRPPTHPTAADLRAFSAQLVKQGLNDYVNYLALVRYGRFARNNELFVAAMEFLDGSEVMDNLYRKLAQKVGEQTRDAVFRDIALPSLGVPHTQKYRITAVVMDRLEELVDPQTCREILSGCLRNLQDEWYLAQRDTYLECGSLDAYLARKAQDFIAQLEQMRDEGSLYFTQPITDEVIGFVRDHPEINPGVLEGNVLYEAKIPYMTQAYLHETDERLKRYHYCHCPWARESLRHGDVSVSATFCHCSAGFTKKPWEVIFGQPLQAELVESVLKGDPWCMFAIHLPEQALQDAQATVLKTGSPPSWPPCGPGLRKALANPRHPRRRVGRPSSAASTR